MGFVCSPDFNYNILAKGSKEVHQALDRIGSGLAAHQAGNVGLLDAKYFTGLRLRQLARFDNAIDSQRKACFELLLLRVGKTEVGEDIAGAFLGSPVRRLRTAALSS